MLLLKRSTLFLQTIPLTVAILLASPASAQVAEILVIPTGEGPAFEPTARMARVISMVFNKGAKSPVAKLWYPFPETLKPTKKEIRKAKHLRSVLDRAFRQMNYRKVDQVADQLRDLEKDLIKKGRGSKGYVTALHYLAATAHANDRVKKAFRYMNDAVLFDSSAPSKEIFSSEVTRLHQRVLAERNSPGKLQLTSTPPGLVWFNNTLAGLAQGTVKKPAGLYLIKFYRPGHMPRMRWFRVHAHRKRDLDTVLNQDASPELPLVAQLRAEAAGKEPGDAIKKLTLEQAAIHVALVGAEKGCSEKKCTITVSWAEEDTWRKKSRGLLQGDLSALALKLIPKVKLRTDLLDEPDEPIKKKKKPAVSPLTVSQCITDSQCSSREKCEAGRCMKYTPVTRKWWFWTIVGAVAVGAVVGIAVPLSLPDSPVIEVQ